MSKKEIHNAVVTRNTDSDMGVNLRGAIFFEAPTLFEGEYPLPAYPCFQWASKDGAGFFVVPKVDDEIEIEIEVDDGTFDTTDVELPEPRWRCMIYSDAADIDNIFKENYPFRMGYKSNSGHYWLMDDTEDNQFFSLISSKGHEFTLSDVKDNEHVLLKTVSGHQILLDDKNDKILFSHNNGTKYEIDTNGDWLEEIIRNKVEHILNDYNLTIDNNLNLVIGGKKTINVTGDCELTCSNAKVTASNKVEVTGATIELNGSTGQVLTNVTDPFVDLVTGQPTIGVNSVLAG